MNWVSALLADPLTYVLVVVIAGMKLYLERRITAKVDQQFAERLEIHKHSLEVLAEHVKFDLQRRLGDFSQFVTRKHEAAAKSWEACRIAHGSVSGLFGLSQTLTFEEFNVEDMKAHLDARQVPKGVQESILGRWDSDRDGALAELKPYLRMLSIQSASRDLALAQNTTYLHELYFPGYVLRAFDQLFSAMVGWVTDAEYPPDRGDTSRRCSRQELNDRLEELRAALRRYITADVADNDSPMSQSDPKLVV
jgi:hypothetical protein